MSNQPDRIANTRARDEGNVDQIAGTDAGGTTSEWFKRAGYYAAQAVANAERAHWRSVERRLEEPSRMWTGSEVVRSYRTNADGERRFRDEAEVFTPHGYRPWLETRAPGNLRGALVLIAATSAVSTNDSNRRLRGKRSVSWISDASPSEARLNDESVGEASASQPASPSGAPWKMLFQMPHPPQQVSNADWRCAGCGVSVRGTEHHLPTFCPFCRAWAQWRRDETRRPSRVDTPVGA